MTAEIVFHVYKVNSTYRTHMVEVDIPLPPEAPLRATLVGDSQ